MVVARQAAILIVAAWIVREAPVTTQSPPCDTPLTEAAITRLVSGGVPAPRLRQLMASCGIDLGLADAAAVESRLKQIGVPAAALTFLAPPTTAVAGTEWTSPLDRRTMVFIPAGRRHIGSPATERNRDLDEEAHEVAIANGFWIDSGEVTNAAYQRFLIARPEWQFGRLRLEKQTTDYLRGWQGTAFPEGQGEAPVAWVTWHAARAYAAWAGKRLPTEAEWEYGARGGSNTRFWWGDDFDAQRVVANPKTGAADAARRQNPWGVRDVAGGVWEWTSSLYQPYPFRPTDGREEPLATGPRVIRGGSWVNGEVFLRSANRSAEEPAAVSDLIGFRCVR